MAAERQGGSPPETVGPGTEAGKRLIAFGDAGDVDPEVVGRLLERSEIDSWPANDYY